MWLSRRCGLRRNPRLCASATSVPSPTWPPRGLPRRPALVVGQQARAYGVGIVRRARLSGRAHLATFGVASRVEITCNDQDVGGLPRLAARQACSNRPCCRALSHFSRRRCELPPRGGSRWSCVGEAPATFRCMRSQPAPALPPSAGTVQVHDKLAARRSSTGTACHARATGAGDKTGWVWKSAALCRDRRSALPSTITPLGFKDWSAGQVDRCTASRVTGPSVRWCRHQTPPRPASYAESERTVRDGVSPVGLLDTPRNGHFGFVNKKLGQPYLVTG